MRSSLEIKLQAKYLTALSLIWSQKKKLRICEAFSKQKL